MEGTEGTHLEEASGDEHLGQRVVKANNVQFSIDRLYATNVISTSKYTLLTFLPKNLFIQFRKIANLYFLVLLILQLIPQISSLSPITTAIPLVGVLAVIAIKDAYDDVKRHQSDNGVNNRVTYVVSRDSERTGVPWKDVHVGSIIRISNNDFIAADMLLLSTSDSNGLCYVETAELDGETNLKVRQTLDAVNSLDEEDLVRFDGKIVCERPNNVLDKFEGTLHWDKQTFGLDNSNILLRGFKLRNTEWAYGVVIFGGFDTKLMQNSGKSKIKRTRLDHVMNELLICILVFLIVLCIISAGLNSVYEHNVLDGLLQYIPYVEKQPDSPSGTATLQFFSYIILLNTLVPISLYVSVEFIRFGQSMLINWDRKMYYEPYDTPARARTTTLNEELGQIEYIFSDKTGTLTQNIMTFLKCTIAGRMYGHWLDESEQTKSDGAGLSGAHVMKVTAADTPEALEVRANDSAIRAATVTPGSANKAFAQECASPRSPADEELHFTLEIGQGADETPAATTSVATPTAAGSSPKTERLPNAAETPPAYGDMPSEPNSLRMRAISRPEVAESDGGCLSSGMTTARSLPVKPAYPIDFAKETPYGEQSFSHFDRDLLEGAKDPKSPVFTFFHCLSVCHSVVTEVDSDQLLYQAQSPDENALVSASRNFGLAFTERTPSTVTVDEHGTKVTYEVLCILDFNNVRKRMSVIVRDPSGKLRLVCKGADNVVFARLSPLCKDMAQDTQDHLNVFAQQGLRTLCIAYRDLTVDEWEAWHKRHHQANTSLEDRDGKLSEVYEEIEKDMTLVGASAIEDKLQDGVPDTIANLARANIKIWVLTGDKDETAINIGYACKLLTPDMQVFLVDGKTEESVCGSLTNIKRKIDDARSDYERVHNVSLDKEDPFEDPAEAERKPKFGIVINGHSLAPALNSTLYPLFLNTAILCRAVICCRVTPLQKANVVALVKENRKAVTLAIGDGANDVGMIQTAHIGVGISGQEGMQAVLASDYSFAQFAFLQRLLLVHGRWSYMRMCKFLGYFFYKNFSFVLVQFWFAFFCAFTAQAYYDPWFITIYNVVFTSLPVLVVGIMDQDVSDTLCLQHPRLYIPGQQNLLFNKKTFAIGITKGILVSLVIYFGVYFTFREGMDHTGKDLSSLFAVGAAGAFVLVVIVNLQLGLDSYHWTVLNHIAIWGSILMWFIFAAIVYSGPIYGVSATYLNDPGAATHLFASARFWLCIPLLVAVALLPIVALRYLSTSLRPLLVDRIRAGHVTADEDREAGAKEDFLGPPQSGDTAALTASSVRSVALAKTVASKLRRSKVEAMRMGDGGPTQEIHSGYSFSYTPGFGELITSGRVKSSTRRKAATAQSSSAPSAAPADEDAFIAGAAEIESERKPSVDV